MFQLLKLPRELRDKIYECALVRERIYVVETRCVGTPLRTCWLGRAMYGERFNATYGVKFGLSSLDKSLVFDLNLLSANRQVYVESSQIFYGQNRFHLNVHDLKNRETDTCTAFMSDRPPHAQKYIGHVSLAFEDLDTDDASLLLQGHPKFCQVFDECFKYAALQTIEITLKRRWYPGLEQFNFSQSGLAELLRSKGLRTLVLHLVVIPTLGTASSIFFELELA